MAFENFFVIFLKNVAFSIKFGIMNSENRFPRKGNFMLKVIKREGLSREEYALASFLQGGVNKKHPGSILIDVDIYIEYVKESYVYCGLWDVLCEYLSEFDGVAIFDMDEGDVGINLAATVCAVENLLGVPRTLYERLESKLPICFDASDYKGTNAERQEAIFNKYRDRLNPSGLVHQVVLGDDYHLELRDFAISKGYFTFFTDENEEDLAFRGRVLLWANRNIPIYGWTTNEIAFLKNVSAYGNYVVPMDWSANHSYFSLGKDESVSLKQKNIAKSPLTEGKHYVAIVVSDGDNVQWLERDFATTSTYGQRLRSPMNYKMNWTISPSMVELCPLVMQGLYDKAKNDYFITGVSGIGYTNLLTYPMEHIKAYAELTADAMVASNLEYMCMLDNTNMLANMEDVRKKLDTFASYNNIKGAIWEMDPNRYEDGKGRIFFSSNGKPFISVRLSLWHHSNRPGNITHEWLDEYANIINSYPVSPNTVDGYTVLNIHPWTVCIDDLDYLVSKLEDHVELVYVSDMLEAIEKNVPHEDAMPKK